MTCCCLSSAYCGAGMEVGENNTCVVCQQGFYKVNASEETRFDRCTMCPEKLITEGTGATQADNCTRGKLRSLAG